MPLNFGLHHHHTRQQAGSPRHPVDRFAYLFGILAPIAALPQLITIWTQQDVTGVSMGTWASYLALSTFWSAYSIVHRQWPLILMYVSQWGLQIFIIVGIFRFS